ncbi:MAG: xanthine dehydrogenase family protein molybdopterin-binding subunit [Pseudolabrys sp.]
MTEQKQRFVGQSVPRLEDRPLLTGKGRFAADISFPGQWTMRIVRSPVARGRLKSIDAGGALALSGVYAVWTHADVAHLPPIPFRLTGLTSLEPYRQPVLAKALVRYVGEPIAAVFAQDQYVAEDAADMIDVSIEQMNPILSAVEQPGMHDHERTTEAEVLRKSYGDIDAAFRIAHAVVALELSVGRHSGVPLETRGAVARYDEARGILEMHGAAKVPHWNRDTLARMFGFKTESVQLFEGHVGGGFGIRGELYPEDVLVCAAALKFRRPVKWIEDRREHLVAANHSRQQCHHVRAAIDSEGHILAVEDEFFHDNGAYMRTHAATVPAAQCGIDKVEVRRRNLLPKSARPYDLHLETLGTQIVYDSGDYALLLDRALELADWSALQADIKARRAQGEMVGAGIAMFVEKSGLGPFDTVRIEIKPNGIEVVTGDASVGQGIETVVAQICAEGLGVDYRDVTVIHGQTDRIPRGMGAFASRVTVMCGEATRLAAEKLRDAALTRAAELMQTPLDRLDIVDGQVIRTDQSGASMPVVQLAGLSTEATFETSHMVYPYGVHVAAVRVDAETGRVAIEKYAIAYDVGRAVNPRLVKGQLVGGLAQGIGGALYEEFLYDEQGQPLSVTFADYLMPTAREVPNVSVLVTEDAPSPLNVLGLKGAGEAGTNAAGAAIASAIDHAIGITNGVAELPIAPGRLYALMKASKAG